MKKRDRETDGEPVPRDPPDQQASEEDDRWDPGTDARGPNDRDGHEDVPDVDEAGAGPRGAPRSAGVRQDQPVPDEPSG
nr:hypothetical protein [Streptomyces sp. FIT100]